MRSYERSHPWINFTINLGKLSWNTWMLLGEAVSKCEHVAGVPLKPAIARELNSIYLSKGIHGTTSIEGNTLTEDEVRARVQGQLELPLSRDYQGVEVDNILKAYNEIVEAVARQEELLLTPERIQHFNRLVLKGLDLPGDVVPGEYRTHSVGVGTYRGAPAEDVPYLVEQLCKWLESGDFEEVPDGMVDAVALIKAVVAHLYIAWIHPFGDGNGRTARLIEFQLLVQARVPTVAAHLLSDHYNLTRDRYYRELSRSSQPPYPLEGFIDYALQGFTDELRNQIARIRDFQLDVTWENYVHEAFRGQDTPARLRQKHLVLALPHDKETPRSEIRQLTPELAVAYHSKGPKTVSRDLNALAAMHLIHRSPRGIRPNREMMLAFLPLRADRTTE